MASLTVRQLDEALKARLRLRAARHGRSMEDEIRGILRNAAEQDEPAPPPAAAKRGGGARRVAPGLARTGSDPRRRCSGGA
jgi:phosphopantothenoylcysteine decarboxylase/phosphopantothenate--cysteine ligase